MWKTEIKPKDHSELVSSEVMAIAILLTYHKNVI